ncbi:MAG: hypothetical protein M0C28_31230 [Candidatus Moduliflexus flocculans]|nr:hypothetical protein [Candidatus Moduliflexus flocculans]
MALPASAPLSGIPSFARGSAVQQGRLVDSRPSPDGTMLLYLSPVSPARGDLILFDLGRKTESVVARSIEYSAGQLPGVHGPPTPATSSTARPGDLYYFSAEQSAAGPGARRELAQDRLGPDLAGTVERQRQPLPAPRPLDVPHHAGGILHPGDLFGHRASRGILVGKAPFPYDPNFDSFWISPDGSKVLLCKDGRNIFLYRLDPDDFGREAAVNADAVPLPAGQHHRRPGPLAIERRSDRLYRFAARRQAGFRRVPRQGADTWRGRPVIGIPVPRRSRSYGHIAVARREPCRHRHVRPASRYAATPTGPSSVTSPSPGALHAVWVAQDKLVLASSGAIEMIGLADGAGPSSHSASQATTAGRPRSQEPSSARKPAVLQEPGLGSFLDTGGDLRPASPVDQLRQLPRLS